MKRFAWVALIALAACAKQQEPVAQTASTPAPAATPAPDGDIARGREVMSTYACVGCHIVPGSEMGGNLGPSLEGWAAKPMIIGKFPNKPDNVMQWLQNPQSMDPETTMPGIGPNPLDARDMTAFLFTLK